jgi:hypothetical protein
LPVEWAKGGCVSWLNLDDNYAHARKFNGWKPAEKWALLELKLYCARQQDGGRIPSDLNLLPRCVTRAILSKAEDSGWLRRDDNGELWVRDWYLYNGTLEQRVEWFLQNHPAATANDVTKAINGNRQAILAAVRGFRPNGSDGTGSRGG